MNVFSASKTQRLEDRVTRAFVLVLGQSQAARQAVLDHVLPGDWDRRAEVWEAIDHPFEGEVNQPDMLLRSAGRSVVCEHKLLSPLGQDQLERYLFMPGEPYVLLVSHARIRLPAAILTHPRFIHPEGSHHFTWAQIYSSLTAVSEPLVKEFLRWLDELGFAPVRDDNGKIWLDHSGREPALFDHLEPLVQRLEEEGWAPRRSPGGHGVEVIAPLPWVRFVRFHALSKDPRRLGQSDKPMFAAWLYVAEEHARQGPWIAPPNGVLRSSPRIKSKPLQLRRSRTSSVVVREWRTPLGPILAGDGGVRAGRFADRVIADLKGYEARLPTLLEVSNQATGRRPGAHTERPRRRPREAALSRTSWLGGLTEEEFRAGAPLD